MFSGIKKAISKIKEKIATTTLDEKDLDKALWEFEINLVENNVSEEIAQRIVRDIKSALLNKKVPRFTKIEEIIDDVFKNLIEETFRQLPKYDLIKMIKDKQEKPFVIVFIGINGNGKTTSIAKLCYKLKNEYNLKCLLACSDTFRAGAIEQLEKHAKNLNVEYIKHKYGASPTAVAYSAVEYAYNKKIDVVLIDTAGRMQTDKNLVDEMKKLIKVIEPDFVILVVDSLSGNDAYYQAEIFGKEIPIHGYIVTKVDADEKGGVPLSLIYATKKPILYLGIGTNYEDLIEMDKEWLLKNILK